MEIQMKKIVSLILTAALLLGSLMVLTSCDENGEQGAQINVYLGAEVFDFDPTDYYVDSNADQVMSLLYEPLFKLDSNGELQCAGASDYSVDTTERTISISLRTTYWSDEVLVKAEDYIYAWREVLLDPNSPNPAAALLYRNSQKADTRQAFRKSLLPGRIGRWLQFGVCRTTVPAPCKEQCRWCPDWRRIRGSCWCGSGPPDQRPAL